MAKTASKKVKTNVDTEKQEQRKALTKILCGLATSLFALFSLFACVSYLFTWKADQSLLSDPEMMDAGTKVSNVAGKIGYNWSHLLLSDCFGFGSFALVLFLFVAAVKLLSSRWKIGWIRSILTALSAAYISSVVCTFVGNIFGLSSSLGNGLGGLCGSASVRTLNNLFGPLVSFLVIALGVLVWLICVSPRFAAYIRNFGKSQPESQYERDVVTDTRTVHFVKTEPAPIQETEPEIEATEEIDLQDDSLVSLPDEVQPASKPLEVIDDGGYDVGVKKELERIDVKADLEKYEFPPLDLLNDYASKQYQVSQAELESNSNKICSTLLSYKIKVKTISAVVGPTVTLYKVVPDDGVRISAIKRLDEDIALSLGTMGVRVTTQSDCVGIEVANEMRSTVPLKSMLNASAYRDSKAELPIAIGYTIQQKVKTFDLADAPHLLVAGTTKQGKSVGLNVIVSSLLYAKHPADLKFVFIDPKMVEFTAYKKLLHHYLAVLPTASDDQEEMDNAIVKQAKDADDILRSLTVEMDERYLLLSKAGVNNVKSYNEKYCNRLLLPTDGHRHLPYLVVIIDEFADLTMSVGGGPEAKKVAKGVNTSIIRLAQKGRAAGIHVVIATQRPSVDVVTPLIKTNFPTRIAFRVATRFDSGTILDSNGAEKLIGNGDMIYYAGVETERVQCAYVSMDEINAITSFIGNQQGYKKSYGIPYYLPLPPAPEGENSGDSSMVDMQHLDSKFEEAARLVVSTQRGSTSDLQRKMGIGYAKAGRIMDQLQAAGVVGPQDGSKPRQVLVDDLFELEGILSAFMKGE